MDTPNSRRMRKSEFDYVGENADHQLLYVSENDRRIAEILHPQRGYQILSGPEIAALTDQGYLNNTAGTRLGRLARHSTCNDGRPYLVRYKQDRKISKASLYSRHKNFDKLLNETPVYSNESIAHLTLQCHSLCSIELGVKWDSQKRKYFKLTKTHELDLGPNPDYITLPDGTEIHPDIKPTLLQSPRHSLYFVGEIQRSRSNVKNRARFKNYHNLFKSEKYKDPNQWGLPNLVVLFICKQEDEMNELINLCKAEYCPNPKCNRKCTHPDAECSHIGFTSYCDPWNDRQYPAPTDTIFTRDFIRIGYHPTSLLKMWD